MTEKAITPRTRRSRGMHPKSRDVSQNVRGKGNPQLPEYLNHVEVNDLLACAPSGLARLLMLIQWRSGLRVTEAINLTWADIDTDVANPTLRVRRGKGNKTRIVPLHSELNMKFTAHREVMVRYPRMDERIIPVTRKTAHKWVQEALQAAVKEKRIVAGRSVSTHTLRHSYARHLLLSGIQINFLSRWLGHARLEYTLRYLELLPDPAGSLAEVP